MKKFLAGLVSLLMLSTAFAEPTITHLGYTAYLGSSNELYLQDPTGTVRVLRYPIADILSITDTVVMYIAPCTSKHTMCMTAQKFEMSFQIQKLLQ